MTDDSKEYRFNSVISYLRESGFTISDEKHTIVTSEFYAKIISPEALPVLELISYPSLGNGIMFQAKLVNLKEQFPKLSTSDLKNRIELDIAMKEMLNENEILLSNTDEELMIQKNFSIDPQKTESKFEILDLVSTLQTVTKNVEKWVDSNIRM
ncbi:hypothetical protein [Candidatus Nitrosocosmicus sp. SS]|uniref:hypothetical protein n=1 Tax=Candidatus Nitrosocosmicus agrestis TaxID=2563600 RepID=UPI00122E41ED|nr:hypothetical protein [Candidatus Nitrosocosmicus sp. SS]KAA2280198.1 hypothetical protein F1Z66_11375 [Candidatus Nitrosocosmicus sp. SS]KAF0869545.1 hypothetical protein E5N71_04770 [Candidatus Nitrosocosmicus sp. SS]MDR4491671.1 hypothetical protein [Candidatus Nitrosocosmicus sp.]